MVNIIAYAYDADYHCPDCTVDRFREQARNRDKLDEKGVPYLARDSEGNHVHPVFDTDGEVPPATCCCDCGAMITEPFYEQALTALEKKLSEKV